MPTAVGLLRCWMEWREILRWPKFPRPSPASAQRRTIIVAEEARAGRVNLLAVFRGGLCRILDGLPRRLGTLPADDVELLVLKLVGGDEELF